MKFSYITNLILGVFFLLLSIFSLIGALVSDPSATDWSVMMSTAIAFIVGVLQLICALKIRRQIAAYKQERDFLK